MQARASLALLLALAVALPTAAQEEDNTKGRNEPPLVVESDEMVIRDTEQKAVYTGNVVATRGAMTLRSERLVVDYTEAGMRQAHAYGDPVRLRQGKRRGHADEATYFAANRSILLVGNAHLEEGANVVDGARIRYFLDGSRTEVFAADEGEEGGRARSVYDPANPPAGGDGNAEEDGTAGNE